MGEYTVTQIDEITKGKRRNCNQCPFSRLHDQAPCAYRNTPDEGLTPFTMVRLEERREVKRIPCLKNYLEYGLHGYIDPVSGQPVVINRQAAEAILSAIDNTGEE